MGWLVLRGAAQLCAAEPLAVLYVEEADSLRPAYSSFIEGLRQGLAKRQAGRINLYTENLDLPRFDRPGYRAGVEAWLRKKYQGVRLDAVVASGDLGSEWVMQMRQEGWAGIPMVLIGGPQTDSAMAVPVRTTRVEVRLEARQTLELAWRLWPGAKRVVVLGATVSGYARVNQQLDAQFQEFASVHGLELRRLSGLTMAEYRRQAAAIPPDSLIRTAVPVADPPHRDPPGVRRVAVANPDHRRLAGASGTTDPRRAGFGAGAAGLLAGA